jgi:hypothetical protein
VAIDTDIQLASMRQLHCAIEHLFRGDFECAITLGAASGGMLPNAEHPLFREKLKNLSESDEVTAAGGATGPNDIINWLTHGGVETAKIPAEESVVIVWRAIRKFHASYGYVTPQMKSFQE